MMDLTSLLVFTGALFVAAASPGPGIAAIVARVLGGGMNGAIAFTAGVALGDVVWLTFAVLGLGLSACAVVDAGATVVGAGAQVAGTAVSVTADVVTAPFGSDDSNDKKK